MVCEIWDFVKVNKIYMLANWVVDYSRFNYKCKLNLFRTYYEATKVQKFA
jgi:hypothetical protein